GAEGRAARPNGCGADLHRGRGRMRIVRQQPAGRVRLHARGQFERPRRHQQQQYPRGGGAVLLGTGDASLRDQRAAGQAGSSDGYPGVSLVTGPPYKQIGLAAKRSTSTSKKLVTLAAGATANAQLQIVDALNFPSASCGPTKATALKIYPPNQTEPVYMPNNSTGCGKPVQILFIGAVRPAS